MKYSIHLTGGLRYGPFFSLLFYNESQPHDFWGLTWPRDRVRSPAAGTPSRYHPGGSPCRSWKLGDLREERGRGDSAGGMMGSNTAPDHGWWTGCWMVRLSFFEWILLGGKHQLGSLGKGLVVDWINSEPFPSRMNHDCGGQGMVKGILLLYPILGYSWKILEMPTFLNMLGHC